MRHSACIGNQELYSQNRPAVEYCARAYAKARVQAPFPGPELRARARTQDLGPGPGNLA